jgi:hypothetical protein
MAKADLINEINSKDLAPEIKEKALAAIERIAYIGESDFDDAKTSIIDAFGWDGSQEGYNFWSDIFNAPDDAPIPSPHLPPSPAKEKMDEVEVMHTPGPWKIATKNGNLIHGVVTEDTHIASIGGSYQSDELRQANARLIASAPALLAENLLLKEQVRVMREAIEDVLSDCYILRDLPAEDHRYFIVNHLIDPLNQILSEGKEAEAAGGGSEK